MRVTLRFVALATIAASLWLATAPPPAGGLASAPGTPGTPQPATLVYAEDFQNRPGPSPIVRLTGYTGTTGATYTAAPTWLIGCNGWIASANESTTSAAQIADCANSQVNWNRAQQLAQVLGMAAGQSTTAARDNYAVSAYTSNSPGAGLVEFQTAANIPFATSNRFITFSVDVAAINCGVSAPVLQFSLLNAAGTAIPAGTPVNACSSTRAVTAPALGAVGAIAARVGTYTANGSVLITGSSIGVRMVNNNGSGNGNDHAFDNITILDVTPQLDKAFVAPVVGVGQPSKLSFTVTNTEELASKNGWSFTDDLPPGLTIVGPAASTTCPAGIVTAPVGGSTVSVTGNLSAGMASCTVTVSVTSAAIGTFVNDASSFSSTVGVSPPGTATVTFTEDPALSIVKSSTTALLPAVGGAIPYSFLVTNTGNVEMTDITVTDPNSAGISCPVATLAPGTSTTCTGNHTVTQADLDAGAVVNTATVTGKPPIGSPIPPVPSNQVSILAAQLPALSIVKSSTTVTIPGAGQTIPYSFLVTNTGNVTMTGIVVTDPNTTGVTCPVTSLAPAASTTCTGDHTVVQAEVDAGAVTNGASVVGTPPNGPPIAPVPSNQVTITGTQDPALAIVKASNTTQLPPVGAPIPYSFLVTNIGNVTMTAIAVTDPNTGGVNCPVTVLAPGASTVCTGEHTVVQNDLNVGQVVNTASVSGTPPGGTPIPPVVSEPLSIPGALNPALAIVKATTATAILGLGDVVPYTFTVVNIGNVSMSAITVTDPNATDIFCSAFTLDPGSATACTGSHTVTQADLDAGEVRNTASVVGTPPSGTLIPATSSNEITIPAAQVESLSILKSSTTPNPPAAGDTIPYQLTVTNTGNVTITGVVVADPTIGAVSCPETTLGPGASTICTATYTVTAADVTAGQVVNTASVTGTTPKGTALTPVPSNEVTTPTAVSATLAIVKSSTTQSAGLDQVIPFTFTVTNTGNTTMNDIAVTDPNLATISCPLTTLTAGVAMTCTGDYTVTQADVTAGQVVNTASVVATPAGGTPIAPAPSNQVLIPVSATTPLPPPTSVPPPSSQDQLPSVGSDVARMLRLVPLFTLLGSGLLLISRRRDRFTR